MSAAGTNINIEGTAERNRVRNAWYAACIETLLTLRQKFPRAFARLNARIRRPLKIGIHLDMQAAIPDLDPVGLSRALRLYVSDLRYHRACTEGAVRIDLDGNACGTVSAAEAENSKRSLQVIEARLARRREQRAACCNPAPTIAPEKPKRLTPADLRAAAANRKVNGAAP
jgi:ProP effector